MTPPSPSTLQVAQVWKGRILAYRLVGRRGGLSLGTAPAATFLVPDLPEVGARFTFVRRQRGACTLRLAPGMGGAITRDGVDVSVADLLAQGPAGQPRDARAARAGVREVVLGPGDRARLTVAAAPGMRLDARWVEPPAAVPRPGLHDTEPFLLRIGAASSVVLGVLAFLAVIFANRQPPPTLALSAERMAKIAPPALLEPTPPEKKGADKPKEKDKAESGQTKKAKGDQGRLGTRDADQKDTVIPKGDKDILRDKVSKVGILGLIGRERAAGSGIAKLFADNTHDMEQAMAGLTGTRLVAGRGAGGLSTTGSGLGGGGTGLGHLYGAGELDTGGRGRAGRGRGPSLAGRKEHEVTLDIKGGNVDEGSGLSREQVARVVRAHQSAVKFCYEKELQRKPHLSGTIEINWTILPDGSVDRSKLAKSDMGDDAVEGCAVRQVKQWAFPKSDGRTMVTYPFVFRGGA